MAADARATTLMNERTAENLAKRPRVGESIIQALLFLCGALSILTTLGIVYILGTESLHFFTNTNWENTNKRTVVELSPAGTSFEVGSGGAALNVGDTIRLEEEWMEVTAIQDNVVTVIRGIEDSPIVAHNAGKEIL
ncbi:MAG: hypothetical protein KDE28_09590, partial [Anaerolineales bacterium]|nr:hypothetical protein [Anaerolineales bacterium]